MGILFDILKEIPLSAILREKLQERENQYCQLEKENKEIKEENHKLKEENHALKEKIKVYENVEDDPCPRCHKRGWHIEDSKQDETFGILGAMRRTYKCSFCGFSESNLIE